MSNIHAEEESSKIEVHDAEHGSMPVWLMFVIAGLIIWGAVYLYLYW